MKFGTLVPGRAAALGLIAVTAAALGMGAVTTTASAAPMVDAPVSDGDASTHAEVAVDPDAVSIDQLGETLETFMQVSHINGVYVGTGTRLLAPGETIGYWTRIFNYGKDDRTTTVTEYVPEGTTYSGVDEGWACAATPATGGTTCTQTFDVPAQTYSVGAYFTVTVNPSTSDTFENRIETSDGDCLDCAVLMLRDTSIGTGGSDDASGVADSSAAADASGTADASGASDANGVGSSGAAAAAAADGAGSSGASVAAAADGSVGLADASADSGNTADADAAGADAAGVDGSGAGSDPATAQIETAVTPTAATQSVPQLARTGAEPSGNVVASIAGLLLIAGAAVLVLRRRSAGAEV